MCEKKCYACRKYRDENDGTYVFKHFICKDCLNDYLKSDSYCREKFLDIIWQSYIDKPNFHQLAYQYDTLIETYNFTPQGLLYALQYYMKRKDWNTEYLLYQAFPSLYYEARDYHKKELNIKRRLKGFKRHTTQDIKGASRSCVPPLKIK